MCGRLYGQVGMEFIDNITSYYFDHEEEFFDVLEQMDSYNEYLGSERVYPMEELNDFFYDSTPVEILTRAYFGYDGEYQYKREFNPRARYFMINGIGNLVSRETNDHYWDFLDDDFVETLYFLRHDLYLSGEVKNMILEFEEEYEE